MARYFNPDYHIQEKSHSSTFATSLIPFFLPLTGDHSTPSFNNSSRMFYTGYS